MLSSKASFPLILLLVCLLAFGLFIVDMGFYWDDWPNIFIALNGEGSLFADLYAADRPLNSAIYSIAFSILGVKPLNWQLFSILMRWLSVLAIWRVLKKVWPTHNFETASVALLFAVYPSFTQQHIAVVYSQHFIAYGIFFVSLWFMLKALGQPNRYGFFTFLALITSLLQLGIVEYFVGLELIRPLFIYLGLRGLEAKKRRRLFLVLKRWLPYLATLAAFALWRLFLLDLPNDQNEVSLLNSFGQQPFATILSYMQSAVQDFVYTAFSSWYSTLQPELINFTDSSLMFSYTVGVLAALGAANYLYLLSKQKKGGEQGGESWSRQAILLGIIAIFLGMLPTRLTDREVLTGLFSNRFTVPAMFGAALFWAGLARIALKDYLYRSVLIALLVGLAVGLHVRSSNDFRWEAEKQKRVFWQFYWRAADIEAGTPIIGSGSLTGYLSKYSAAIALNALYNSPIRNGFVDYWYFELSEDIQRNLEELRLGIPLQDQYRYLTFEGSSKDALVTHYESDAQCLWVLSDLDKYNQEIPAPLRDLATMSNLERIDTSPRGIPPPIGDIFGPEPAPTWCFYYQRMDAARQYENWEEILSIWEQAKEMGLKSSNSVEMIPVIQALLQSEAWSSAMNTSLDNYKKQPDVQGLLCRAWELGLVGKDITPSVRAEIDELFQRMKCE